MRVEFVSLFQEVWHRKTLEFLGSMLFGHQVDPQENSSMWQTILLMPL